MVSEKEEDISERGDINGYMVEIAQFHYWLSAVSNTLECSDCDICADGKETLSTVEDEMREYVGPDRTND